MKKRDPLIERKRILKYIAGLNRDAIISLPIMNPVIGQLIKEGVITQSTPFESDGRLWVKLSMDKSKHQTESS